MLYECDWRVYTVGHFLTYLPSQMIYPMRNYKLVYMSGMFSTVYVWYLVVCFIDVKALYNNCLLQEFFKLFGVFLYFLSYTVEVSM